MNYFLILVILALCAGAYYQHTQDEQQIATLQQQLTQMGVKPKIAPNPEESADDTSSSSDTNSSSSTPIIHPAALANTSANSSPSTTINPTAAAPATQSDLPGTITTLDGRSFQECKILKIESDGITFSHSEGITKILYPLLRPELQKKYGYDPQKAVAQTAAQINYQQAQQAAQQNTPATAHP